MIHCPKCGAVTTTAFKNIRQFGVSCDDCERQEPKPDVVITAPTPNFPYTIISQRIECSPEAAAAFAAMGPLYLTPLV